MNDMRELLEQQALWQKARQELGWPEKIRMVEQIRESVLALRQLPDGQAKSPKTTSPKPGNDVSR